MVVSAAIGGDHNNKFNGNVSVNLIKKADSRHSNDVFGKNLSGTTNNNGQKSSSGKNSGNSTGNGNHDAKSGSFNFVTANSPITEATVATSGFCHSRSTGVLGGQVSGENKFIFLTLGPVW